MAALTVGQVAITGIAETLVAAAGGGDSFENDGKRTFFVVSNGSGGSITVTFDDSGSPQPPGAVAFNPDVDVAVGAGARSVIGPFPKDRFGATVSVTYSGVTSLTVGAFRL